MDTLDRPVQPAIPAMPPLTQPLPKRPSRRRWLGAVTIALALGLVASGVFAVMESSALSAARSDFADAETEIKAGERKIESLEDKVARTQDDLESANENLGRSRDYGDACYAALRGFAKGIGLYYQAVRAADRGHVDSFRSFRRQSAHAFRATSQTYQTCMNAPPVDFGIF